jgi:hypothetical protein
MTVRGPLQEPVSPLQSSPLYPYCGNNYSVCDKNYFAQEVG